MHTLGQDILDAIRGLARHRRFVAAAIIAAALGIGANTATFSFVNAILLRPLPYPESDRVVAIWATAPDRGLEYTNVSYQRFETIAETTRAFSTVTAYTADTVRFTGHGEPAEWRAVRCSRSFLDVLGVQPAFGRNFVAEEDQSGGRDAVILTDDLWRRAFGSASDVLGSTLTLDGRPHEVVGVLPRDFVFPGQKADVLIPRANEPGFLTPGAIERGSGYLDMLGRLTPDSSLTTAEAELDLIAKRDRREGFLDANLDYRVRPLMAQLTEEVGKRLGVLMAAVVAILLAACANIAGLSLARAVDREKEMAIRSALGADRWRLLRRSLTESLVLGIAAGVVGLGLAWLGVRQLVAIAGDALPRGGEVGVDSRVLTFTLAATVATSILFGILPALAESGVNAASRLREERGGSASRRTSRLRDILVVTEIAFSTVLLIGAGLLFRSLMELRSEEMGFRADHVLTARIKLSPTRYDSAASIRQFFGALRNDVAQIPGVDSVGAAETLPLEGGTLQTPLAIAGRDVPEIGERDIVELDTVSPGYFDTMRIPLLRGRVFDEHDNETVPIRVVINQSFANHYFADDDPLGQGVFLGRGTTPYEIIGVVGDVRENDLATPPAPTFYLTSVQRVTTTMALVARTNGTPPEAIASAVRAKVSALDPDQPVSEMVAMEARVSRSLGDRRLMLVLISLFASIAFALAVTGIYAVVASSVGGRSREIGVRRALGAEPRHVLRLVLGHGLGLAVAGVTGGLAAALAVRHAVTHFLYRVDATDPLTFAAVALLLLGVALLASLVPARRASRIDPVAALRD